jgi:hypothetical protein
MVSNVICPPAPPVCTEYARTARPLCEHAVMYQHRMTHIAVQGIGINSDQFRDTMDSHLESMGTSGWELVSTNVSEQVSTINGASSVDALLFWKKPALRPATALAEDDSEAAPTPVQ